MQMKSFDGRPVHVGLTDGSAITVTEARIPEKFVSELIKTGRVWVIHDRDEEAKPAPRASRSVKPHDEQ